MKVERHTQRTEDDQGLVTSAARSSITARPVEAHRVAAPASESHVPLPAHHRLSHCDDIGEAALCEAPAHLASNFRVKAHSKPTSDLGIQWCTRSQRSEREDRRRAYNRAVGAILHEERMRLPTWTEGLRHQAWLDWYKSSEAGQATFSNRVPCGPRESTP